MKYPYVKRLPKFEYLAPKTVDEALLFLSHYDGEAKAIAGGTDILLKMKRREDVPRYLVGLKAIPGLDYVEYNDTQGLRFGPNMTIHAMEISPVVKEKFPLLCDAASTIGSVQIRNLGTVVGNICNALPSADMLPSLIVLGATINVASKKGEKNSTLEDFLIAPGQTALAHDELVLEVLVPSLPSQSAGVYIKHAQREAMDLAIVSVATLITLKEEICSEVKICLGSVGPTPIRAIRAEAILRGKQLSPELVKEASNTASEEVQPRSSIRSSAEYRKEMVQILTSRALKKAKEKLNNEVI